MRFEVRLELPIKTKAQKQVADVLKEKLNGQHLPFTAAPVSVDVYVGEKTVFSTFVEHRNPREAKANAFVVGGTMAASAVNSAHEYSMRVRKAA